MTRSNAFIHNFLQRMHRHSPPRMRASVFARTSARDGYDVLRGDDKLAFVTELFDVVAESYDRLNDFISLGAVRFWRWWALLDAFARGARVLDVGCGPGNVTAYCMYTHLTHMAIDCTGVDCSGKMLKLARRRCPGATFIKGDAGSLGECGIESDAFDVVTTVYTLRNFPDLERALGEMYRCVKPGGKVFVLDAFPPRGAFAWLLRLWLTFALPTIGWLLTRNSKPYAYLANSIQKTATADEVKAMLESFGAERASVQNYWPFGAAAKVVAYKPEL